MLRDFEKSLQCVLCFQWLSIDIDSMPLKKLGSPSASVAMLGV